MTDDVILSTQYYIKYINRAILANLQRRPLKLGRLIVLQKTHLRLQNILFPWQLTLFQSPPTWFQYVNDLSAKNVKQDPKLKLPYLYACWIMSMRHHCKFENGMPKEARNAFNIWEIWNPVCCHVNKTVKLKLWNTFTGIFKHFWFKLAEISFFHYIWSNSHWVYDVITWPNCIF